MLNHFGGHEYVQSEGCEEIPGGEEIHSAAGSVCRFLKERLRVNITKVLSRTNLGTLSRHSITRVTVREILSVINSNFNMCRKDHNNLLKLKAI